MEVVQLRGLEQSVMLFVPCETDHKIVNKDQGTNKKNYKRIRKTRNIKEKLVNPERWEKPGDIRKTSGTAKKNQKTTKTNQKTSGKPGKIRNPSEQ